MELEQKAQIQPEDVIQVELPIGLPPKHFAELCERYERYFKGDGKVQELCFNDKVYHLCIQNVMAFPQDYAAMMTRMTEIREIPKVVGIDIGRCGIQQLFWKIYIGQSALSSYKSGTDCGDV